MFVRVKPNRSAIPPNSLSIRAGSLWASKILGFCFCFCFFKCTITGVSTDDYDAYNGHTVGYIDSP